MDGIETCADAAHKPQRGKAGWRPSPADRPGLAGSLAAGDNAGMEIVLNGEMREIAAALSVLQLLQLEGLAERRVAVEVNGAIVPRSRHAEQPLAAGDRIEIVHALGGG